MDMTFFSSLSSSVQLAFIIAGFIIVVLFLGIIFFAIKTKNIRSTYFSMTKNDEPPKSFHSSCKHKSEIEILLLEQQEMLTKYFRIFEKEIVSMCMKEVEEEVHKIYYQAIDIFRETVARDSQNSLEISKNFQNYMDCLKNFAIDQFRIWIRENHFAEKTEAEFDIYSSNKAENLENFITTFADKNKPHIEEKKFFEEMETIYPQIRFSTIIVLKKCRTISIQKQEEAQKLRESFNNKVKLMLGGNYGN